MKIASAIDLCILSTAGMAQTTPVDIGGTTEAALKVSDSLNTKVPIHDALFAALNRAKEWGSQIRMICKTGIRET